MTDGGLRSAGLKVAAGVGVVGASTAAATLGLSWLLAPAGDGPSTVAIVVAVVLATAAAAALAVQRLILRPLERLCDLMSRAEEGDFLVRAQVRSGDELARLAEAFNRFLRKITDLQVDVIDATARVELELRYKRELQAQAAVIERTNRELKHRVRDLTVLADASRCLSSSLDLARVLEALAEVVGDGMGLDRVAFRMREEGGEGERLLAVHGDGGEEAGAVTASVPIRVGGKRVGVLEVRRDGVGALPDGELRLLRQVARQAALAVRNGRLTRRMLELAITDGLTGLFNRRQLDRRLAHEVERARRFESPLGVLMIDIDHFKELNDRYGHLAGDRVLQGVAQVLKSSVRAVDTVARYGGEEFTLLLPRTDRRDALEVADKLRRKVAAYRPDVPGVPGDEGVSISAGVAVFPPDAPDAETVLAAADAALLRAKSAGRDRVWAAGSEEPYGPEPPPTGSP